MALRSKHSSFIPNAKTNATFYSINFKSDYIKWCQVSFSLKQSNPNKMVTTQLFLFIEQGSNYLPLPKG